MLFNRVAIDRLGAMRIFYFGLIDDDNELRASYACAIDEDAVQRHKEQIVSYVAQASSEAPPELQAWRPKPSIIANVDVANVILVARSGALAELRFYNFAIGDILEAQKKEKDTVQSAPVALLRCEVPLQRSMFLSLYSKGGSKNAKK